MDEGIHIAELELDRRPYVVEAHDGGVVADDFEPAVKPAPVVVRHLEDEQVFEQVAVALGNGRHEWLAWLWLLGKVRIKIQSGPMTGAGWIKNHNINYLFAFMDRTIGLKCAHGW